MAEGASVGAVYLDLIVRDTVESQIRNIATKAQEQAKQAFSSVEKIVNSTSSAGKQIGEVFNKSVAMAQARVKELQTQFDRVTARLKEAKFEDNDKAVKSLYEKQITLFDRLEAARERLAIAEQAAAQKEVIAAQKVAAAQAAIAEKQAAAAKQGTAPNPPPTEAVAPAVRESGAEAGQISFWKRLQSLASGFGAIASKAFSGVGKLVRGFTGVLGGLLKRFTSVNKSTSSFGTRLKGIVSGALIFNGISAALRNVTSYLSSAIKSTDQMKGALANLQGAAKTAATPIIEAITPALVALANAAATALHYVAKLFSMFTGKSVSDMAKSAKAMDKTSQAASKMSKALAGFDEITKLSSTSGGSSGGISANYGYSAVNEYLETLIDAIHSGDWLDVGKMISTKISQSLNSINWQSIKSKAGKMAKDFAQLLNGLFATPDIWTSVGTTIAEGINTAAVALNGWSNSLDWVGIGASFAAGLNNLVSTIDWEAAAASLSDTTIGLLNSLTAAISEIDWQKIGNEIANFLAAVDWNGLVSALSEGIGAALAGIALLIWGLIEDAWNSVVDWWNEVAYEDGQFTMEGLLQGIEDALVNVGNWLKKYVFDPLVNGVKKLFGIHSPSTVMEEIGGYLAEGFLIGFEQITDWIKGCINGVITFINNMIAAVCEGINFVITSLNKLSFEVPNWVPVIGGQEWGFSIGKVTTPEIPLLANGGVIEQPTLAMMGEYAGAKSNPEIAAPQSLIEESVANVMQDLADSNIAGAEAIVDRLEKLIEIVAEIELGDTTIGEAAGRYNRKMRVCTGSY